jgi:Zn-dependent protease
MYINVLLALMIIVSFLIAIPLHESSHALVASWLGDKTPRAEGRLSLSLRSHIDPIGTLMCVILAFQPMLGVGFGWGKPVKPDPWKMRVSPNTGVLLVACAGPIFSLLIGIVAASIVRFLPPSIFLTPTIAVRLPQFLIVFASVNICLAIFNLIPLYPLDGYTILYTLLPSHQAVQFARSATYGPLLILAIFFLLPFLGQIANMQGFFLFQLPYYFWLGSTQIIALVTGLIPDLVQAIYLFK